MLAAVLEKRQTIVVKEVPDSAPGPGEVKIAVEAVGICGTDVHAWLGSMEDRVAYPHILGHEFGGHVLEAGRDVENLAVGDRVTADIVFPCGECRGCQEGHANTCQALNVFGIDSNGAMAQHVIVQAGKVHRLPDSVAIEHSIMAELYAVAVHAVHRTKIEPGDDVVILGAGRLGLAVLDVAKNCGARRITVTDVRDFRLDVARRIGADVAINVAKDDPVATVMESTGGFGADKVIECIGEWEEQPGQPPPCWQAVEMMRPSGQITVMGQGPDPQAMPWRQFVLKEGTVTSSRLNMGDLPRAIDLMAAGRLRPELIVTHELPLSEAARAFEMAHDAPDAIKVVLRN